MTTLLSNVRGQLFSARNLLVVSFLLLSNLLTAQITAYSRTELNGLTYTDFTLGTAGPTGDDGAIDLTLPFVFSYNGTNNYTTVRVCTNGWVAFAGGTSTSFTSANLFTTTAPNATIAGWFGDGNANGVNGGSITAGDHPSLTGVYVVQFRNNSGAGSGSASPTALINFQVHLYGPASSNPGRIEILYGSATGTISTGRSIGIEDEVGGTGRYINALNGLSNSTTTASAWPGNGNGYRFDPPTCLAPTGFSVTAASSSTADLQWTSAASSFEIEYGVAPLTQGSGLLIQNINATSQQLTGLSPSTNYQAFIRADCGVDGFSGWVGPISFSTTQIPVSVFPYNEGFETGGTEWTLVNGTQTNKWAVGTATNNGGTQALYVSNDNGVSNAYSTGSSSVVHAYRDIAFSSGFSQINLSFDWRCAGELTAFDRLRVYIAPTTFVPLAGTQIAASGTAPTGIIQLGLTNFNGQPTYTAASISLPAAYDGQNARLIFEWRNDGSDGTQPPAALDNINITLSNCSPPTNLTSSNITSSGITINWVSSEPEFEIEYGIAPLTQGAGTLETGITGNTATLSNLQPNTTYQFFIRSNCGSQFSPWDGPFQFRTAADNNNAVCFGATELPIPDDGCDVNDFLLFPIEVSGLVGTELGTNVFLDKVDLVFSHTWNADINAFLISPNNVDVLLVGGKFGSGDNLGNPALCPNALFTLQDGGTAMTTTATGNVVGTFAPDESLAGFNDGSNPNGVWFLAVCDAAGGDLGALRYVKLSFEDLCASFAADAGNDLDICDGESATLTATGGGTYEWSTGETTSSIIVSPIADETYTVTVTDGNNCGLTDVASVTVTVNPFPTADAGTSQDICSGETATLTATGGLSYVWSNGETTATINVSPLVDETYTVTVIGAGGCEDVASVDVTVNQSPVADAGNDELICIGDDVTLNATGGGDYEWSTGETTFSITVAPTSNTTYTVTVTAANGCTASDDVLVEVNTLAPGLAGADQEICLGESATLTATGGNTYEWSNGETTASITVSPTSNETYVVTITVASGCTTTDDVLVTVNALPTADAGSDEEICLGETVTLTATGGVDYEWSTTETTANIDVTPSANETYTVTVTDANGCTASASVNIDLFPLTVADAGNDVTICPGGTATLTATGGVDYEWSTSETAASIDVTPTANETYTVTVTDANGCTASDDVVVSIANNTLTVTSSANEYCEGDVISINSTVPIQTFSGNNNTVTSIPDASLTGASSVINLSGTGNVSSGNIVTVTLNITHTWNSDLDVYLVGPGNCGTLELTTDNGGLTDNYTNTVLSTNATTLVTTGNGPFTGTFRPEGTISTAPVLASGTGGGTYTLPNTAISGCPINGNWTLRVFDDASGDLGSLQNWSLLISEPIASYASHTISGPGTITQTTTNNNATLDASIVNAPVGENTYESTLEDLNGCTVSETITVKVYGTPQITSVNQTCTVGNDGEIEVIATLDNGNFSGSDIGEIEYSFDGGNTWGASNIASNLSAGTYLVVLRNSASISCETALTVTITAPPVVVANNSTPSCEGQDFTISTQASGGIVSNTYSGTNSTSSAIPDGSLTGTSSVINLNASGNVSNSSVVSVTLNITHAFASDVDVYLVGPNGCGTLELTTDNGDLSDEDYVNTILSTDATTSITTGVEPFTGTFTPEGTITTAPNLASGTGGGTYNLPATAIDGCPINGDWTLRVFDDFSIDAGTLNNWSLSITEPLNYTQTITGPGVVSAVTYSGANNSVASAIVSDAPIGENEYTITVTDANGCSSSSTTIGKVFDTPSNVVATAFCAGASGGSISVSADPIDNANFTGSDIGDLEYSFDNGTSWVANNVATGLSAGIYNVFVRNSANPFCQFGPVAVEVFEAPTVSVNDPELCVGATVDLFATSPNTVTYEWSTSETTSGITVNADGDYFVTVTDANGCTATDTATVTPGTSLTVVLTDYEFCDGNTVVLDASNPGATYEWSNGETTQTIIVGSSDIYSVTVTAAGCTGTASSEVVVNPNPVDNLSDAEICDGDILTLDAGNAGDGFVWSTGETSQTIDVTLDNTYSVTVTNQFGCETVSEATVTVNALPVVALSDVTVCQGTPVVLDAGNAGATYTWFPNGETTQEINVIDSDTYAVTVTDANNCSATASATVVINDNPVVAITGNLTICEGETTNLFGSGTGDYEWSNTETTVAIAVLPTVDTQYSLTVTDANGCSATDAVTVVVNTNPEATITGDLTPCSTTGTTLTADGGADYEWSNGETTASITVLPQLPETFTVTVTAQNGCTDTETVSIAPVPGPTADAGSDVGVCEGGILTIFGAGGTEFEWSTGATTSNLTISPVTTTTYSLTVTDPNGCTDTDDITVFVSPLPTVSVTVDDAVLCSTDDAITVTTSPLGGTLSGTGVSGNTFDPASAGEGSYILTYTFTDANECTNSAIVSVAVQTCSSVEELVKALESASVYPNPFMNQINISFVSKDFNDVDVRLFDVLGKQIVSETMQVVKGENTLSLNTNSYLAGGVYYLQLVKEDKSVSFRLMKTE